MGCKRNETGRQSSGKPMGEIIKTNMKPSMLEIFKGFEQKYGVKIPCVSDQYFDIRKDFL